MPVATPPQVLALLKKQSYSPIYFLQGEEVYYIDLITDYIQAHALQDFEKAFNLSLFYGKEHLIEDILAQAQQYPFIGDRQVILVKEAQDIQDLQRETGQRALINYLHKPNPSTILVLAYKHKTILSKTKLGSLLAEKTVFVTTKLLYDNQIPGWITQYAAEKGFSLTEEAAYWLHELVGNNLTRLTKELDKVVLNLQVGDPITAATIEAYVGRHKQFNAFELQKALAMRDNYKAHQLILQVTGTRTHQTIIPLLGLLCTFFTKLLLIHTIHDQSPQNIAKALQINHYFVPQYLAAAKQYPPSKIVQNIGHLQEADKQIKGVGYVTAAEVEILKELVFKLLH